MKTGIAVFPEDKFIIYCDGKTVDFIGTADIINDFKTIINDKASLYNAIRTTKGDQFNPVEYFATSSMNFIPDMYDYSPQKLEEVKKAL